MDTIDVTEVLREATLQLPGDSARLFHGRGNMHPDWRFLNVDWFAPVVWAVIYGEQDSALVAELSAILTRLGESSDAVECVMLQRRLKGRASQEVLYGQLPGCCHAREDGAIFELKLSSNQNIGFFLDARPGRQWLRQKAQGRRVLNLFAYTCSFSVAALQGGADSVVNIDMAKSSLATGQRNHALNGLPLERAKFLPHDVFRSTRKLESLGPYDLLVIDPPSRQKGSFEADKDYGRLLGKLAPMLAPGAEILACLNAPYLDQGFLPGAFAAHLPACEFVERLPQREDFPERDLNCCLKMQVFRRV